MIKKPMYEIHGYGSDAQAPNLAEARKIAKRKALLNFQKDAYTYIVIYKYSIPGNPYSKTILVEKWKANELGQLSQTKV
jgi:hypothetical protein